MKYIFDSIEKIINPLANICFYSQEHDKNLHFCLSLILTVILVFLFRSLSTNSLINAVTVTFLLGLYKEIFYDAYFDLNDIIANISGITVGILPFLII